MTHVVGQPTVHVWLMEAVLPAMPMLEAPEAAAIASARRVRASIVSRRELTHKR